MKGFGGDVPQDKIAYGWATVSEVSTYGLQAISWLLVEIWLIHAYIATFFKVRSQLNEQFLQPVTISFIKWSRIIFIIIAVLLTLLDMLGCVLGPNFLVK